MSDIAIRVDQVSKRYRLGASQHDTLRDVITSWFQKGARGKPASEPVNGDLLALSDVSFEVKEGETVGIIGRNGAGKSTLLKVLSRITEPTTGQVDIYGRVGSLLEVGTGFHPELTGRENIYLNGAILGMRRQEIARKFDEIVAFSELERFLDTPVKRYSSGMYVRLAFAVAAHLEPEVLIVDEVLAVGDVAFQRKCLGKMSDVSAQGRTVLFVSHNLAAVQSLCTRGILLRNGAVAADADVATTIREYLATLEQLSAQDLLTLKERGGRGNVRFSGVSWTGGDIGSLDRLVSGQPARFTFSLSRMAQNVACGFTIYDLHGTALATFNTNRGGPQDVHISGGTNQLVCEMPELLLVPGRYRIDAALWSNGQLEDHVDAAAFFDVAAGHVDGRPVPLDGKWGSTVMHHRWFTALQEASAGTLPSGGTSGTGERLAGVTMPGGGR